MSHLIEKHSPPRRQGAKKSKGFQPPLVAYPWRLGVLAVCFGFSLNAAPVWKAPEKAPFGALVVLELREDDPAASPLPRPAVDQTLGPLRLRSVDPTSDGRGWKLTVQALAPGRQVVAPLDLGDGRRTPELKLTTERTAPFGGLWMAIGGGPTNELPDIPFPWAWASLVLVPLAGLAALVHRRWRAGAGARSHRRLRRRFAQAWPPPTGARADLDAAHALGRDLLAATCGEAARSWGAKELQAHHLAAWAAWTEALDRARFTGERPTFPAASELIAPLEKRS